MDITRTYANWQAWLAHVTSDALDTDDFARSSLTRYPQRPRWFSSERSVKEFYGTDTFDDAVMLARRGWPEGARKAQAFSTTLVERVVGRVEREDIAFDVEGAYFDTARLLRSEPEHWIRWETTQEATQSVGSKCISICLNGSVHWAIDRDIIVARGAAVVALAALLEYANFNVELTLAFRTENHQGQALTSLITLKRYGEPSDVATIAFALAHPSSPRRLNFAAKEQESKDVRRALGVTSNGVYGYPKDLPEVAQKEFSVYLPAGSTENGFGHWNDANATESWVLDQLVKAGVRVLDTEGN